MKFLVLSDIHGDLEHLGKLEGEFKKADAVLFAGDFAKFAEPETAEPVLEKLCSMHNTIFSVIGNCDEPDFIGNIEAKDISVQKSLVQFEGLCIAGSGGGLPFGGAANEREDAELATDFNILTEQGSCEWDNLVAIMHNPPKDTDCDKISAGIHVGSESLRAFIEQYKPLAVVTGHIHESVAVCKIGNTTVINPGALMEGRYGWLEVCKEGGAWQVKSAQLCTIE